MWCGFISLDRFRFKGKGDRGDQNFLLLLASISSKGAYALYSLPTSLVITKRRSQERKEGLEPSTSALARLCSTIKLFPPATVVAKHY